MTRRTKRILFFLGFGLLSLLLAPLIVIFACDWWITAQTSARVYEKAADIPFSRVGVVLGTSASVGGGKWSNPHFTNRIVAAATLYKAGKVRVLIVSGSNPSKYYDEPSDMRDALVQRGVPASAIVCDYAGFRTLDTIVRAKEVFGLDECIVITDRFHTYRTLFLADHFGLRATAFAAKDVDLSMSLKTRLREKLANCKAVLDLYILGTKPKFLGEKVALPNAGDGEGKPK